MQQAVDALCKMQDGQGAWHDFSNDADASIESTAMAVHAMALAQPGSWPRIAARARDWLESVQQDDGSWTEPGTPGPTYLTVLVLDAIALANGEKTLTFRGRLLHRSTMRCCSLRKWLKPTGTNTRART